MGRIDKASSSSSRRRDTEQALKLSTWFSMYHLNDRQFLLLMTSQPPTRSFPEGQREMANLSSSLKGVGGWWHRFGGAEVYCDAPAPKVLVSDPRHHSPTDPLHDVKYLLSRTLLDVSMSSKEFSGELATHERSFCVWVDDLWQVEHRTNFEFSFVAKFSKARVTGDWWTGDALSPRIRSYSLIESDRLRNQLASCTVTSVRRCTTVSLTLIDDLPMTELGWKFPDSQSSTHSL